MTAIVLKCPKGVGCGFFRREKDILFLQKGLPARNWARSGVPGLATLEELDFERGSQGSASLQTSQIEKAATITSSWTLPDMQSDDRSEFYSDRPSFWKKVFRCC